MAVNCHAISSIGNHRSPGGANITFGQASHDEEKNHLPTPQQRNAFTAALGLAMQDAGVTGRALAASIGVTPATVSKWLRGKSVPAPDTLARVEELIDIEPGSISQTLGYVPASRSLQTDPVPRVRDAIRSDPHLGPREQSVLIALYQELIRQYGRTT
ncbi:MAG: helix-turn-helix domain-containing protein [Actinomycetota bacterium]